jgi:hypothetical protein
MLGKLIQRIPQQIATWEGFVRSLWSAMRYWQVAGVLVGMVGCSPTTPTNPSSDSTDASVASVAGSPDRAPPGGKGETDRNLSRRIEQVLAENLKNRSLRSDLNAAWQIFHGVIAYGDKLPLETPEGALPALRFAFGGGQFQGWELAPGDLLPDGRRGMRAKLEPGSYIGQGHVDQWLAILAQAGVEGDRIVQVGDQSFTVFDWARQAQWDVPDNPIPEYAWTMIALMHYFPDEQQWMARDGRQWDYDALVDFEAKADLGSSACGGTHRLQGLAHALAFRKRHQGAITGPWEAAQKRVDAAIQGARQMQNSDGSLSTNYTDLPGRSADLSLNISATGHMLEFLAFALPQEQLGERWVEQAAHRLCDYLEAAAAVDLDCGGLYHALHGLAIYQQRTQETLNASMR